MSLAMELAKRQLEDAFHSEAIDLAIKDGKNYYFCLEDEQNEYDKRGREVILKHLVESGVV